MAPSTQPTRSLMIESGGKHGQSQNKSSDTDRGPVQAQISNAYPTNSQGFDRHHALGESARIRSTWLPMLKSPTA